MVSGRNFSDVGEFSSRKSTPLCFVTSTKLACVVARAQASPHAMHRLAGSLACLAFTIRAKIITQRGNTFLHRNYPVGLDAFQSVYHPRGPRDCERIYDLGRRQSEVKPEVVMRIV